MPRRSTRPEPGPANLSPQQMRTAIPKLERRIEELRGVDVSNVQERGDPLFDALEQKIDDALVEIFGNDTIEYERFRVRTLDTGPLNFMHEAPLSQVRQGYQRGIELAASNLQTIVDLFREKLDDLGETPGGRAVRAFGELDIHPEIESAIGELFRNGHYANAVEDACKVLDQLVKKKSSRSDLSGTKLMQAVFSPNKPVLRFNDLKNQTDLDQQQGMMFLYSGAMLALRNPRAHELIQDDPEKALEYIGFLSLLAKSLDTTAKT
jgi:uncharacterized protein (TIGR02391 family)